MGVFSRGARAPDRSARWQLPSPAVLVLATVGAGLLAIIAATSWPYFSDEQAYWSAARNLMAGQPLYDIAAAPNQPFAYWYPPVLAQVLAPWTLVLSSSVFSAFWTILLLACLWQLAGRDVIVALALVAFLPVALELRVRNVHLVIALLTVLALRRSWIFWIPAAAIKVAPVVGPIYLLAAGRRREAALTVLVGLAGLGVSIIVSPNAWLDFAAVAVGRASADTGGLLAIPYVVRLTAAILMAVVAGRRGGRAGEIGVVVAIFFANPTLWANAMALLVAIVPLVRSTPMAKDRPVAPG